MGSDLENARDAKVVCSTWQALGNLISAQWWRGALRSALIFAPRCISPAAFWALACITTAVSMDVCLQKFQEIQRVQGAMEITDLLMVTGILMLSTLLTLVFLIAGFGGWLVRLSAYCRYLSLYAQCSDAQRIRSLQDKSMAEAQKRLGGTTKTLLIASLYMIVPFFAVFLIVCLKLATIPLVAGEYAIPPGSGIDMALWFVAAPLTIILLVYSFVSLVVASVTEAPALASANHALKLAFSLFPQLSAVIIVFSIVNSVLASPGDLVQLMNPELLLAPRNVYLVVLADVWQAAASVVLFPLSMTPICDVLKGRIKSGVAVEV